MFSWSDMGNYPLIIHLIPPDLDMCVYPFSVKDKKNLREMSNYQSSFHVFFIFIFFFLFIFFQVSK